MDTTKLTPANTAKSLRTTVPMSIVKQLKLTEDDFLNWEMDKIDGEWVVMIRKA